MTKLTNTFGFSKSLLNAVSAVHDSVDKSNYDHENQMARTRLNEADRTYPFKANQLAPLVIQLRSILNFLSKSGLLNKAMRENRELFRVYVNSDITDAKLNEMINFVDNLVERHSDDDDDDETSLMYPRASRPGGAEHVISNLISATDFPGPVQTQSGSYPNVSSELASKILDHLYSLPTPIRAEHAAIFHRSIKNPKRTAAEIQTALLMQELGDETPDGAPKPGRGRPRLNQDNN